MRLLWLLLATGVLMAAETAQTYFERGRALFEEHDDSGDAMREAEVQFRHALELNPRHAPSLAYLGLIAAEENKPKDAETYYRRALEIDSKCAEALVGLARIPMRVGHYEEARALYRQAVAAQPENAMALAELSYALIAGDLDTPPERLREAMHCWQALIRLDRDNRDAHHELARAFRRFEMWPEAEREYREVLRIGQTPEDMDVWVYTVHGDLAEVLEKQGRIEEAIAEWQALAASEGVGDTEIASARARIVELEKKVREAGHDR